MSGFGVLNWTVLVAYVAATLGLGVLLSRRVHTADDFFLAGRTIPWWAIGISVVATYVSALSFLGGPAWSYREGFRVIAIHLNYPLVIFIVVTFFLPFFYNSGVPSIYAYLEERFGSASRTVMSSIFLITQTLTTAAVLYATALVIEFITGIDVQVAIILVTVLALGYTLLSGIAAVIWTDVIQAIVLLVGAVVIFVQLLGALPGPVVEVLRSLNAEGRMQALDLSVSLEREATVWSGLLAMTLFHTTVYGANQMMVQRTLAARSLEEAKKAYLMMGFAAFFIYFLFIVMGPLFFAYYDGRTFENGNTIILEFANSLAIPGLLGLIAAAVVAASMSSLDSSLNSMATASAVDFYQRFFRPKATSDQLLRVSRHFTVLWAVVIVYPALQFAQSEGSVLQTLSKVGSYFVGAKLSMFALGFFSKHATEKGVLVGVAAGFVVIWAVALNTDIAWPWYCAVGASVNVLVALVASRALDGAQSEWHRYTIRGQQQLQLQRENHDESRKRLPGSVDRVSWLLLVFLVASVGALFLFDNWLEG
ncbi:MAG: sodium/solute symporter [Pseudomonadota bacterium]